MEGFGEKFMEAEQPVEEENTDKIQAEAILLEGAGKEKKTALDAFRQAVAKKTTMALLGLSMLALFSAHPGEARAEDNESLFHKVKDVAVWFRHDDYTSQKRISGLEAYKNQKAMREQQKIIARESYENRKSSAAEEIRRVKEENAHQKKIIEEMRGR